VIRLNQMIDRGDWEARDRWACVVRQIHETQGTRPAFVYNERGATTPGRIARSA
jgi:hypothetical protein